MTDSNDKNINVNDYVWWKNDKGNLLYSKVIELDYLNRMLVLSDGQKILAKECNVKKYQEQEDSGYGKRSQEYWDRFFLNLAKQYSTASRDPSTKVGAILTRNGKYLVAAGYNGFAKGVIDSKERYENREFKIRAINHAEVNCCISAKQDITGCTLYTYPFICCERCAPQIIQWGISRVCSFKLPDRLKERWGSSCELAIEQFNEAGVQIKLYE